VVESNEMEYPVVRHDDLIIDDFYRELQATGPIRVRLPYGESCWLATSYEDVRTVYGDRRFSRELGADRDAPRMMPLNFADNPAIIANMDPPRHTRLRRLTLTAFSASQIQKLRGWIEEIVDELLSDLEEAGPGADYVELVAWALPLRLLTGILGVKESDIPIFREWVDTLMAVDEEQDVKAGALGHLLEYIGALIAERRANATDDLLSIMVNARDNEDQLNEEELLSLSLALFLAGFETTAAQLGSTLYVLMSDPRLWRELQDVPALLPGAVEELWRWIPSFRFGMPNVRWAKEDVELSGGVVVCAGDPVLPEHQVANRDESVFPGGWEIDFHRVEPRPHLSLAVGAHRCLGAHLADYEIQATLRALMRRFPTLELAVPPAEITWSSSTFLRSPEAVPVRW
jgi:cytochrome P450 RapN